jgi:2-phosphosulfolactate phosphatase
VTQAEVHGRVVFVIDILRATTVMCAAMSHGAKAIIPVSSTEEALRLSQTIGSTDLLLAGERNCTRIPGFQLGNSPLEMTESAVRGKTIILTTTNGTNALLACHTATVYPAAAANLSLAAERGREALEGDQSILIVCAGRNGDFALDDAYCAGRLTAAILGSTRPRRELNDAGLASLDLVRRYGDRWERPLAYSRSGRELVRLGFRADVLDAARLDAYPVLTQFHERRVTLVPVHA